MRPPNACIFPALKTHISRRSASKDNEQNNDSAIKNISCPHLWQQYYKCIQNHTTIPPACKKLHYDILHTYNCTI